MSIRYFCFVFCLWSTASSAAVVVKGLENILDPEKEQVFNVLIQRKHDLERPAEINTDLQKVLPGKRLEAIWVPDTLYQVAQSYYDTEGTKEGIFGSLASHVKLLPKDWKDHKQGKGIKNFSYPTRLEDHKNISSNVVSHWVRFNDRIKYYLEKYNSSVSESKTMLSELFESGPNYQNMFETRHPLQQRKKQTSYLKDNEAFLSHAIQAEERAHREGKLLLWRYSQPLFGGLPDLPFTIKTNSLEETLRAPLEYYEPICNRFSYGGRLLDGFFGDGLIREEPYNRAASPACTFAFLANDMAMKKKGQQIVNPIIYSLSLTPAQVDSLKKRLALYHPREAMPQHYGIYGHGEGFHPSWMLDFSDKKNILGWLNLMKSDALQVHMANGHTYSDPQNNPVVQDWRRIYEQFYQKAENQPEIQITPKTEPTPLIYQKPWNPVFKKKTAYVPPKSVQKAAVRRTPNKTLRAIGKKPGRVSSSNRYVKKSIASRSVRTAASKRPVRTSESKRSVRAVVSKRPVWASASKRPVWASASKRPVRTAASKRTSLSSKRNVRYVNPRKSVRRAPVQKSSRRAVAQKGRGRPHVKRTARMSPSYKQARRRPHVKRTARMSSSSYKQARRRPSATNARRRPSTSKVTRRLAPRQRSQRATNVSRHNRRKGANRSQQLRRRAVQKPLRGGRKSR